MRVWVARPEPGASRTGAALTGRGHAPLVAPVLAIRPSRDAPPPGTFAGIVLTSANGVPALAEAHRGIPVFAVGRRTAARAGAAGFGPVIEGPGEASGLAALVAERLPAGARLLYLAGAERKPEPAAALAKAGFQVTTHVAYRAEAVALLPEAAGLALGGHALDAALHYSRRSAATAYSLSEEAGHGGAFRALDHYCLSADVAGALEEAGIAVHFVAAQPREAVLLDGLAR
jgi:uroporphyrinogen-III synthase